MYIPLGGSKGGTAMKIRNTFIIFIVSGFWHGANWTFIVWGALNAIYFLPLLLTNNNRNNIEVVANNTYLPSIKETFQILLTFGLTLLAWVFFRADNVSHALSIISEIFSGSILSTPNFEGFTKSLVIILMILFFLTVEWLGRKGLFALEKIYLITNKPIRWVFYLLLIIAIIIFGGDQQDFIYFQF